MSLAQEVARVGIRHFEQHDELDSTQNRAVEMVQKGNPATGSPFAYPALVVADSQSAGRGRGQNQWWTGPGSLAFSLIFTPGGTAGDRIDPRRSLAAGVALVDVLRPLLPQETIGLHWPNDVYVRGRKIAGILLEVQPGGIHVLGIGLNTNNRFSQAPGEIAEKGTSLVDLLGHEVLHAELLPTLVSRLLAVMRELSDAPAAVSPRFDELCLQKGELLTVCQGNQRIVGRCQGIGTDGTLELVTETGLQKIYSGVLEPSGG